MKRNAAFPLLAVVALAAGCGGSDDTGIQIDGAWARTSAAGQTTGAIYFELTADADDRLLGASVPSSVAADAQVHEVVMADAAMDEMSDDTESMDDEMDDEMSDDMDDHDMDMGEMRMQELVDGLVLPAGETITFEPGSYHVMLLDLAEPLEVGDEIELTLDFDEADDVTLTVTVAESAP